MPFTAGRRGQLQGSAGLSKAVDVSPSGYALLATMIGSAIPLTSPSAVTLLPVFSQYRANMATDTFITPSTPQCAQPRKVGPNVSSQS